MSAESEQPAKPELHINALLTEAGVNMGDHGQDVTTALVVDADMTVRELCEKHLFKQVYVGFSEPNRIEVNPSKYLTIRAAVEESGGL